MSQKLIDFLTIFNDTNKTAIMLFLLILSCIFRVKGFISGDGFVELVKTTTISFFGTTTAVQLTEMVKSHLQSKLRSASNPNDGNDQ